MVTRMRQLRLLWCVICVLAAGLRKHCCSRPFPVPEAQTWWGWKVRPYVGGLKWTYTHIRLTALFPGLPRWAGTGKVKPIWILLKHQLGHMQVCTSLQTDNHASTPPLCFTGRMPFLPPKQQRQSTEGNKSGHIHRVNWRHRIYGRVTLAILWVYM